MTVESDAFFVVDVGHGSSAVIKYGSTAVVFDVARGATLLEFLTRHGVTRVESVVISHADEDHVGGLIGLLAAKTVTVERVYINADALKHTLRWKDLAYELDSLHESGVTVVVHGIIKGDAVECSSPDWSIEILAPRLRLAQLGAGNTDKAGRSISTNSMSVVARLLHRDDPVALLSGDLDFVGYQHLSEGQTELRAPILIAPHHGGSCGSRPQTAAVITGLASESQADQFVVSHGRNRHSNPRRVVVDAFRLIRPTASVTCTQMSVNCLASLPSAGLPVISGHPSSGAGDRICCGGTLEFTSKAAYVNDAAHAALVRELAPAALCLNDIPGDGSPPEISRPV